MQFDKLLYVVPGLGMMLVGGVAAIYWYRRTHVSARWFWVGVALWTIAVALKFTCAILTNPIVFGLLKRGLSFPALVAWGGLYTGVQSSVFEMGITILAGLIWRQLGKDSARAIAIGVGAGAFEAILLGLLSALGMAAVIMGAPGTEEAAKLLGTQQLSTPLWWFVAPVERVIALLVHASTRALVLLGLTHHKAIMVFWGFWIFALLDSIAGGAQISGKLGDISLWWIELMLVPFALVSVPILRWCVRRFPSEAMEPEGTEAGHEAIEPEGTKTGLEKGDELEGDMPT
jgi:uncharacterized membrane protein YhfC